MRRTALQNADCRSRQQKSLSLLQEVWYSTAMSEETLPGGNTDGAVRIGDIVHKQASPWTPTVHALLRHLEYAGVDGVPRALGFDEQGRQMLTYLPGEVIGDSSSWTDWAYTDSTLVQVGQWMRPSMTRQLSSCRQRTSGGSPVARCSPGGSSVTRTRRRTTR
jgi:hypothetical protein